MSCSTQNVPQSGPYQFFAQNTCHCIHRVVERAERDPLKVIAWVVKFDVNATENVSITFPAAVSMTRKVP